LPLSPLACLGTLIFNNITDLHRQFYMRTELSWMMTSQFTPRRLYINELN